MQKDNTNIAMRILRKEFLNKIDGLCHECCALAYSALWTTILPSKQQKSKMMSSSPATLVLVPASFKWSN